MDLNADFIFASENAQRDGLGGIAGQIRYVAAINPDATKAEFVAAAVVFGFNQSTASIQFTKSRRLWVEDFGGSIDSEGRLVEETVA